jgi:hypothetical protein
MNLGLANSPISWPSRSDVANIAKTKEQKLANRRVSAQTKYPFYREITEGAVGS